MMRPLLPALRCAAAGSGGRRAGSWRHTAVPLRRSLAWSPMQARLPRRTAQELYAEIRALTAAGGDYTVHNYMAVIEGRHFAPDKVVVETELFPRPSLEFYTKKNMGWAYTDEEHAEWYAPERGGDQGDYREGMPEKIGNAVDCLRAHPTSKRAIIPIPFAAEGSINVNWEDAGQTKCCRELHLYVEDDGRLCCTGYLRMQNASIFPKNIHFFATLIHDVAEKIGAPVGDYTHIITNLCHDRTAKHC